MVSFLSLQTSQSVRQIWFMCAPAWLLPVHHIDQTPPNLLQIYLILSILWKLSRSCLSRPGKQGPLGQQYKKEGVGFPYFMPLLVGSFIHPFPMVSIIDPRGTKNHSLRNSPQHPPHLEVHFLPPERRSLILHSVSALNFLPCDPAICTYNCLLFCETGSQSS